ncbi:hypothetical protein [Vagococcus carniphilus]|uniref:DUF1307 domain-containing protein n=1 Tax=Vagococcus carniphilus TaxID=218144 RepID=A0AAW8UB83_9ENTE|nr:hypothetical protein [Vagococcus carniphilus]MDT2814982.1 hypothetical protein [Vagococcus carniphilus]MDT2829804.1 hypothetical protein [Vagococcus carniphilus]MDT2834218.1 hypothetical protein [Vagococcus carniphilus]MDT2839263.1 hypothetical protein [Vagococcus carniphilus]MDT2853322.1 hypothetical protein [Vagococcus carniphilus]
MLKKTFISIILAISTMFILLGCTSNEPSIRIMGITIEKYNSQTKKYETYQQVSKKDKVEKVKQVIEQVTLENSTQTTTEETSDYQFYFNLKTKNADVKQVTYQIKKEKQNKILLGIEGIYHPLTKEEGEILTGILIEE